MAVTRDAMSETFARLTVADRDEGCRIDFAADVRIREPDTEGSTAIVSLEELAARKVLALFGRAAARDFQDVAELRRHFSWEQLFVLATEKDAGFSRERFLEAVAAFDRLDRDEFELSARLLPIASCVTRSTTGRCRSVIAEVPDEGADPGQPDGVVSCRRADSTKPARGGWLT